MIIAARCGEENAMLYKEFKMPQIPKGKVEIVNLDSSSGTMYVRWASGNGMVHELFVSDCPEGAVGYTGGNRAISIRLDGTWVTQFFSDGILFHTSLIEEHYGRGRKMSQQDVLLYASLLNWSLNENEFAQKYAVECWELAGVGSR